MNTPLLSIVIPTFNRALQLELLLGDLSAVLEMHAARLQIVVCDNHSTDDTPAVIERHRRARPEQYKVVLRPVNLGMEGNIACTIFEGDGHYIWTLSDHQRLCVAEVNRAVGLMSRLDFDLGHAKILQWPAVLGADCGGVTWGEISATERGALLFALSNMSTMVFKRDLAHRAARTIFLSCTWGFPHLGILAMVDDATRLAEFGSMSAFPEAAAASTIIHDYDKISVRYRSSIDCIVELCRRAKLSIALSGFFTPAYRESFRGDMLQLLLQPGITRRDALRKLTPVIAANPWGLKMIGIAALASIVLLPASLRLVAVRKAKSALRHRRLAMVAGDS